MDKELDALAKKIVTRKIEVPSSSNTRCIKRFYCEISSIIDNDRTIKSLALALNENGFNIKHDSLLKILRELKKMEALKHQALILPLLKHKAITINPPNKKRIQYQRITKNRNMKNDKQ